MKTICCCLLAIALSWSLFGCVKPVANLRNGAFETSSNNLSEVAPPQTIQQLKQSLNKYQPQVTIVTPKNDLTVEDTTVEVSLAIENFPLFKSENFGLGSHLDLILDNEFYGDLYDERPIILKNLKPGTHTLRVLAQTPWHESYKNERAFAQTTFHVLTKTNENNPDPELPLLTYNQPDGVYSAEPILLDFYLKNVDTEDWLVKVTINDESFAIEEWEPIYLKGFKEGNNLIELELLDRNGRSIDNTFNKTIRLITYNEAGFENDTLAQLITGQITAEEIIATAQQNYFIRSIEEVITGKIIEEDITTEEPARELSEPIIIEEPTLENEVVILEPTEAETEEAIQNEVIEILPPEIEDREVTEIIDIEINPQKAVKSVPEVEIDIFPSVEKTPVNNSPMEEIASSEENQEIEKKTVVILESEALSSDRGKLKETITSKTPETTKPKLKIPQWWKNLVANFQQLFNIAYTL